MDRPRESARRNGGIDGAAPQPDQGLDLPAPENPYYPCCAEIAHDSLTMTNQIAPGEMYVLVAVSWTLRIFLGLRAAPLCRRANRLLEAFGPKARQASIDSLLA